jgi:hypothetical protein
MLRFLCDENFNGDLVRGLLLRNAGLDIVRVQDAGLRGATDPQVLAWASNEGRLVLTHDRATLPNDAFRRVVIGDAMAGVIVVNDRLPLALVIDELQLIATCSEPTDWANRVLYLPL